MKRPNRILLNFSANTAPYLRKLPKTLLVEGSMMRGEIYLNGRKLLPGASLRVVQHSVFFGWGYEGASPLQLAMAILLRYWPAELALEYHLDFTTHYIGQLPQTDFIKTINLQEELRQLIGLRYVNLN